MGRSAGLSFYWALWLLPFIAMEPGGQPPPSWPWLPRELAGASEELPEAGSISFPSTGVFRD